MRIRNGLIPLECNRAQIAAYEEIDKKFLSDPGYNKKWASELKKALDSSTQDYFRARKKWAGQIVNTAIQLMLFTDTIATALFDVINVEPGDLHPYSLKTIPEVDIWQISAHGFPSSVNKLSSVAQYFPVPYRITTDRIYQYLPSVLTGNPGPDDDISARARYEIVQKIEDDLWTALTAALGTFSNAWVYDTRIQDLPTTNTVDLSAQGGLTKGLIQAILALVDKIPARTGSGLVEGSKTAKIRNMFVPSNSKQDLREWVSVVSSAAGGDASQDAADTVSSALQSQMENNGVMLQSMWGEPLMIQGVKRLMGTSAADWGKYLWIFLDGPAGRLHRWRAESQAFTHDDRLPDEEGMSIRETIAIDIPSPYTPNFMRVKFKS